VVNEGLPARTTWAQLDPARFPFDPAEVPMVVRTVPPPVEVPAFVADSLLVWRRWLENLAERFDRLLPLPDPARAAGPDDVAMWEIAVAQLVRTVIAPVVDDDDWQGWCRRVLQWFLTAAAVPVERAEALVAGVIDKWFDDKRSRNAWRRSMKPWNGFASTDARGWIHTGLPSTPSTNMNAEQRMFGSLAFRIAAERSSPTEDGVGSLSWRSFPRGWQPGR
jgi:hypothetical protein